MPDKQKKYAAYRVIEIREQEEKSYSVTIQAINKNIIFKVAPEEILADDNLVDLFSPRDIRTLTYLGYLGINGPKYKILAQRLSEKNDKTLFSLYKKGGGKLTIKSASEIAYEKEILDNLTPADAKIVGYTLANESMQNEKQLKQAINKTKS